ncbi:PucR family transcriptional regulator [Specibacter cremeus]|uniref:PucR family transcriptional regulator n=1 Tax=Specibacter cremeus TaxID=1629051 RepID=UPI000F7881B2|nr:PucR family transcriptional regulator [Specibacter cremeus]
MSAPLSSLLEHPSLADVRVVAGPRDVLVRSVAGVPGRLEDVSVALSGPAFQGGARSGGALLVVLSPVSALGWQFDAVLRRCAGKGVSAVLLSFAGSSPVALDAGSVLLARRLGVAVLEAPDAWRASVAFHEAIGSSGAAAARLTLRAARIGLNAGPDLEETLGMLEAELGRELLLIDRSGTVLRAKGELTAVEHSLLLRLGERTGPSTIEFGPGRVLLAAPVGTGLAARSWLGAVARADLYGDQAAVLSALEVASVAVGHRLVLTRLASERDARHRTALLEEIRDAGAAVRPSLLKRAIEAGWRLDEWHVGIRLIARGAVDAVAQRSEVLEAFTAEGLEVEIVEQVDGWVLWTSSVQEPSPVELDHVATRIRRAQGRLRATIETSTGVGRAQAGAVGLVSSLGEAGDAARLASSRPQTGYFLHVDRLGLAQLLLAWTQTDTFQPAAEQLLAPLGDLRLTLAAYLDAESSLVEAAAVLGVHRNTVADRVSRIERLLGVDLGDPDTRLALHLACRSVGVEG